MCFSPDKVVEDADGTTKRRVTLFGGTGFLGRRIVARLLKRGLHVRVAARHPDKIRETFDTTEGLETIRADVRDEASVVAAVEGADTVINSVALYVEQGDATFRAVHVEGARRVAEASRQARTTRLLQISGIGAGTDAPSSYVRCRAEGEAAVREAFPQATIFRPSAIFGPDDAFLNTFVTIARRFPIIATLGRGTARVQPVCVDDVAEAAARFADGEGEAGQVYELGGPDVYSYRDFLRLIGRHVGRQPLLVPIPLAIWAGLATAAKLLPNPPLTDAQVFLMSRDNIASPNLPGLQDLGVTPTSIETVLKRDFR